MSELVKIRMHGIFAEKIGKEFNLAVNSVSEAFHAINVLTNDGWRRAQLQNIEDNLKYSIVINEKQLDLSSLNHINKDNMHEQENIDAVRNSELFLNPKEDLRSIDIVPVNEGGGPALPSIIAFAIVTIIVTVIQLILMKPPKFDDFREIEDTRKGQSYLFAGPQNTVNEGGPIPLGYGRALVGSQVVAQTYEVYYENADGTDANISAQERVSQNQPGDASSVSNYGDPARTVGELLGVPKGFIPIQHEPRY